MKIRTLRRWFRRAFYLAALITGIFYFSGNQELVKQAAQNLSERDFSAILETYDSMPEQLERVEAWMSDWSDTALGTLNRSKGSDLPVVISGEGYNPIYGDPKEVGDYFDMQRLENGEWDVGYSNAFGSPAWVSYRALATGTHKSAPRPEKFITDTRSDLEVDTYKYTNSGYDRGHLFPNYLASVCYGAEAQQASFLMSNISPQLPDFNRRIWKLLEQKVGYDWRHKYGELHIITGPYYSTSHYKRIGHGAIRVPTGFWKIILIENRKGQRDSLAFMIPQTARGEDLGRYLVSIDQIEGVTGLDMFPQLSKEEAFSLEGKKASGMWR